MNKKREMKGKASNPYLYEVMNHTVFAPVLWIKITMMLLSKFNSGDPTFEIKDRKEKIKQTSGPVEGRV